MRVIGGNFRGKKLKAFDGDDVRPTSDRAREALFNILFSKIIGCDFLDLCSGTGAIGIEALSRNASSCTFVDKSKESAKIANYNLNSINRKERVENIDALTFLKVTDKKFDIIFFDPPYDFDGIDEILKVINDRNLLKEDGVFIYEHKVDKPSKMVDNFNLTMSRKYGIAIFDFYKKEE